MSRVGKHPVIIPAGVSVQLADGQITVKGKLGELMLPTSRLVNVKIEGDRVTIEPTALEEKAGRAMWGTMRANIGNMVKGVSEGFAKIIEVLGVGFKAQLKGADLVLNVGYSHDITYAAPKGIKFEIISPTEFKVTGADKALVGKVADEIKKTRRPEPYKGTGVMYKGEWIRRKEGKKK